MGITRALALGVALLAAHGWPAPATSLARAQEPASTWDGIYTKEQAQRGERVFAESCAVCHGQDLAGMEIAPALAGGQFTSNWNGLSVGELLERVRVSMPLNDPGSLSRAQYADVLAYMFSRNEFPAGAIELSTKTEVLNQIQFKATK